MQSDGRSELRRALEHLEISVQRRDPVAHSRLRPGLTQREVDEVARRITGFGLPADLVEMYLWHDGFDQWGEGGPFRTLFSDSSFPSLTEAIDTYLGQVESAAHDGGWCPAWFPAFATYQFGEFVTLEPRSSPASDLIWSFHYHDGGISAQYDSISSLVTCTDAVWERGLLPAGEDAVMHQETLAIISGANPTCFVRPGDWVARRHSTSRFLDDGWLPEWKDAVGYAQPTEALPAPTPIAQLDRTRLDSPIPIQGTVRGVAGGHGWSIVELADRSGSVKVQLSRSTTEHFDQIDLGDELMVWVQAAQQPDTEVQGRHGGDAVQDIADRVERLRADVLGVRISPVYL